LPSSTDAVTAARAVVGWYGDPTISWSVLLQASLTEPVDPAEVGSRLAGTVARYPHLGAAPAVQAVAGDEWPALLSQFADQPYAEGRPLVRAAVGVDEPRLVVAAHHGVTDGLGLLALLGDALGTTVTSHARGIGDRPAGSSFAVTAARRLVEALLHPPARVARDGGRPAAGDLLVSAELPAISAGSGALIAAAARAVEGWNHRHGARARRQVAGIGVSRRGGDRLSPELDSAFLRLRLPAAPSDAVVRRMVAERPPEPDYPRTAAATPRLLTRALAGRLGSTFLVSNLGVVQAGPAVRSLAFHPTAGGRSGVAIGAATVGSTTTITLRARRADFDAGAADELLAAVVAEL
jgi:hypothetical protein